MKKRGYRKFKTLSITRIVKIGSGTYRRWFGWCEKCKKMRMHVEPLYMSILNSTCSKGHYSDGGKKPEKLCKFL